MAVQIDVLINSLILHKDISFNNLYVILLFKDKSLNLKVVVNFTAIGDSHRLKFLCMPCCQQLPWLWACFSFPAV